MRLARIVRARGLAVIQGPGAEGAEWRDRKHGLKGRAHDGDAGTKDANAAFYHDPNTGVDSRPWRRSSVYVRARRGIKERSIGRPGLHVVSTSSIFPKKGNRTMGDRQALLEVSISLASPLLRRLTSHQAGRP